MAKIEIKNTVLGGLADSEYLGAEGSAAAIVGFDLHSTPGLLKVNQKLTKESGVLVDSLVKVVVPCSNGETYLFSSTSGKIWRRKTDGTYELAYTVSPAAGGAGCLGAAEYQGYIIWATESRLHRILIAEALDSTWATLDVNWGTFTVTNANFHPMREVNGTLYIGDGNLLTSVVGTTFNTSGANTLDIKTPLQIKSLGQMGTDILLGTYTSDNVARSQIIRWNTWSVSYSSADPIPEVGINSFLDTDNMVIVNAGTKGNLYTYDGVSLDPYKTILGDFSGTKKAYVYPNASFNFSGLPLFGLSNVSGNAATLGIYSLGRHNVNYPYVLNVEYLISQDKASDVEIGAIAGIGDIFLASWKTSAVITMTIADPCVVTWTAHGMVNGTPIMFTNSGGALPTGITASTYYYIRVINANTFHLYDTYAHAIDTGATTGRIVTSGSQSGVHTGANYGVDKLDVDNKYSGAYIESRVMAVDRANKTPFKTIEVGYRSLPENTDIVINRSINYGDYDTDPATNIPSVNDVDRKVKKLSEDIGDVNTLQIKISTTASGNTAPEIDDIIINL